MLNQLSQWRLDAQRRKVRNRSIVLLSLILHTVAAIVYFFLPMSPLGQEQVDAIAIDFIKDTVSTYKRTARPKPPLRKKLYNPDQALARNAMPKKIEAAQNKQDEVVKFSPRVVLEDVVVNKAVLNEIVPDLMTDARLREAEASNLSRLIAKPGRTDGRGIVSGRVRARGDGLGRFRSDSQDGGEGLLGGGGADGIANRLSIIDFLDEFEGAKAVVYCLDISASMQAAGLKKLQLAISSIKDSILMLGAEDTFNIVAFSVGAKAMSKEMLTANAENIKRALNYLDRFTPERIQGNQNTDILSALEAALMMESSVIVLITDGLPTTSANYPIETNVKKILATVRDMNVNHASIYVVALEIDVRRSRGAELLISLAEQHNGRLKAIDYDKLLEYLR